MNKNEEENTLNCENCQEEIPAESANYEGAISLIGFLSFHFFLN
jgi:hypothetical protein